MKKYQPDESRLYVWYWSAIFLALGIFSTTHSLPVNYPVYASLLSAHVCHDGVNYASLKSSGMIGQAVNELARKEKAYSSMDEDGKIAYLINLYNLYTLKLIVDNYPLKSIRDLKKPWDRTFVPFKGKTVSLNHIEHDILREDFDEPRIHFAVNCASIGCPALRSEPFTGLQLYAQLNEQALAFLNDQSKNYRKDAVYYVSKIFKWYGKDFNHQYESYQNYIKTVMKITGNIRFRYLDYDWNLNDAKNCP